MGRAFCIIYLFLMGPTILFSHEDHHHESKNQIQEQQITSLTPSPHMETESSKDTHSKIVHWFGNFHLIFLHFPIALIVMTVVSELLFCWYGFPVFDQSSRFMIIAAAITTIPTALFGFALAYEAHYEGILFSFFWWHRIFGVFTTLLTIVAAILREDYSGKRWAMKAYYICLAIVFLSVNLTGYLGGAMSFGPIW